MTSVTFPQSSSRVRTHLHRRFTRAHALWVVQALLAVLFLFAGGGKLLASSHALTAEFALPASFMRFIGCCEFLGAIGVLFPGWLRIRPALTPLAAAGLVVIMIGAVVVTLVQGGGPLAVGPAVVGLAAALVAYERRSWAYGTISRG